MRIRTALVAVILLTPLLFTACGEGQGAEPTPTLTPAVNPIQWEFPLWSEVLREIEDCIPDKRITISGIWKEDSKVHIEGEAPFPVLTHDYADSLDASGHFSTIETRYVGARGFAIEVTLEKDYILYVDGSNIWHYPVFPPESSYIYFPGSIAFHLAHDAGIETEYMQGRGYEPHIEIMDINYTAIGYEFEMWTDEDMSKIIEFLELLEESEQEIKPIISINNSNSASLLQMSGNETEASSLWKIDNINVRHRCCCWILTLEMVFVYAESEEGYIEPFYYR